MATGDLAAFIRNRAEGEVEALASGVIRKVHAATQDAGAVFAQRLGTTGGVDEHPYTRSPGSDARLDTGAMLRAAEGRDGPGLTVDERTGRRYRARVGFTKEQEDYFLYQDQGWVSTQGRQVQGANALATARAVLQAKIGDLT